MVLVGVLAEKLRRFGDETVRVHVDRLHAAALDDDFAALRRGLRRARARLRCRGQLRLQRCQQLAAREDNRGIHRARMLRCACALLSSR
jgi:hypothetical protein